MPTAMSARLEDILAKLHLIAGGDTLLVERALRHAGPKLEDIVNYIAANRGTS